MEVILLLILVSLILALVFLGIFIWATRSGQFEDTSTPALRMLADDPAPPVATSHADSPSKPNPS